MPLLITDGVTTVTLSGNSAEIISGAYFPGTPQRNGASYNDVTETAEVILEGTPSAIIASVNTIERLIDQASLADQRSMGRRLYVQYSVTGVPTYRSEIVEGRVIWDDEPLFRRLNITSTVVRIAVIWQRRWYWETISENALTASTLTNGPAGNTLAWNNVAGTLPAPLRLTLTNSSGATLQSRRFYILNDVASILPAAEAFLYPGTSTASWAAGTDHDAVTWALPVPTATAALLAGERYRILAGFSSISSGVYVRANVYALVGSVYMLLQRGAEALSTNRELLNLGSLNLPPGNVGTPMNLVVVLSVYSAAAGSGTLAWVQICPANEALTLQQNGFNWTNGSTIVHDGMEGYAYLGLTQRHPVVSADGQMLVYPGQTNRLRVLFDEETGFEPSRQVQVGGVYRPRRLTI